MARPRTRGWQTVGPRALSDAFQGPHMWLRVFAYLPGTCHPPQLSATAHSARQDALDASDGLWPHSLSVHIIGKARGGCSQSCPQALVCQDIGERGSLFSLGAGVVSTYGKMNPAGAGDHPWFRKFQSPKP